jgi:hypothetical protein
MLQSSSSADAGADASAAAAAVASPDSETDELAHQLASTSLSPAAAAVPGSPELASHPREKQHATSPPPQTPERSASAKSAPNSHAAGAAAVTPVKSGGKQGKKKHGNGDGAAPSSPSSILSPQRSAELSAHLCRVLDGSLAGLELDSEHVSSKERVAVHQLAEAQQLEHESVGYRPRRCLYIQKPYEENATDCQCERNIDSSRPGLRVWHVRCWCVCSFVRSFVRFLTVCFRAVVMRPCSVSCVSHGPSVPRGSFHRRAGPSSLRTRGRGPCLALVARRKGWDPSSCHLDALQPCRGDQTSVAEDAGTGARTSTGTMAGRACATAAVFRCRCSSGDN